MAEKIITYKEFYSDPTRCLIRNRKDMDIVGISNGSEVRALCDRKWGEYFEIKYAYRGISSEMRTLSELLFVDACTLKPVNGGDVFVINELDNTILLGSSYNSSTGGCTVNNTVYASSTALANAHLYVITNAHNAYKVSNRSFTCLLEDSKGSYITDSFTYIDSRNELFESLNLILSKKFPVRTKVWHLIDGVEGVRYEGDSGNVGVVSNEVFYFYTNLDLCDEFWSTDPVIPTVTLYTEGTLDPNGALILYSNEDKSAENKASISLYAELLGEPFTLYDTDGNEVIEPLVRFGIDSDYNCIVKLDATASGSIANLNKVVFKVPSTKHYTRLALTEPIGNANATIPASSYLNTSLRYNSGTDLSKWFSMGFSSVQYPVREAYNKDGIEVQASDLAIIDNNNTSKLYVKNNSTSAVIISYIDVEVPTTLAYLRTDKTNQAIAPLGYAELYQLRGTDYFYSTNNPSIPEGVNIPCRCFDQNFNEVECNAFIYRGTNYIGLRNRSAQTLTVAMVKFKYPFKLV